MEESTLRWPTDKEREEMEEVCSIAINNIIVSGEAILSAENSGKLLGGRGSA